MEGATGPWRLQLLGPFRAQRGGNTAAFRTRKTGSLLAYLAYYQGRPISKDLLVEALWPEADAEKGRHSFRMALSSIRAALEAPDWQSERYILSDRDTIELREEGFTTDVREFRQLIAEHKATGDIEKLGQAVSLYTGSFLGELGDEWILPQAMELEEEYAQAACALVRALAEKGDIQGAVSAGRKAITLCSTREDLHVALMSAYSTAGQTAAAIKQYEELERMLDNLWGESPGEEAQAVLEGLPRGGAVVAPLAKPVTPPTLPARAPFFGRSDELARLRQLLNDGPRLIVLFGLGGSGKTSIAQRVADDLSVTSSRVWMVSLVGIEEAGRMQEAVMQAIVEPQTRSPDAVDAIVAAIGQDTAVLVLDNLEQIIEPARTLIERLLRKCGGLRVLATSRVPIELSGEHLLPVGPLPLPTDYTDLAVLRLVPSVQLLTEAAQAVRPGFAVTPANAQSTMLLVQKLEGIPLAIELAAAKLAMMTPAQVVAAISRRSDLATTRPDAREQHRSLRTVLEWSLGLLNEEERASFACLSVCRGGFNLELATRLTGPSAEDHVQRLTRASLIGWSENVNEVRFEMLETVREMASQLLQDQPDAQEAAQKSHFDYILNLAENREGASADAWVERIAADRDNYIASLEGLSTNLGAVSPEEAWRAALPLQNYLEKRGGPQAWIAPLEALLGATEAKLDPEQRARAHELLAYVCYGVRDIRATYEHYQKAISAADETDNQKLKITTRGELVSSATTLGAFDEAQKALEEAIALLPQVEDPNAAALSYLNLAWVTFDRGEEEAAEPIFRQALRLAEESGDPATIGSVLVGLGCAVGHTKYEEAQTHFECSLRIRKEAGNPALIAHALYYRALIDYRHNHLDRALSNLRKSYETFSSNGIALGQTCLSIGGNIMHALGRPSEAATCWGRAQAARDRYHGLMIPTIKKDFDKEVSQSTLTQEDLDQARQQAKSTTDSDFVQGLF